MNQTEFNISTNSSVFGNFSFDALKLHLWMRYNCIVYYICYYLSHIINIHSNNHHNKNDGDINFRIQIGFLVFLLEKI